MIRIATLDKIRYSRSTSSVGKHTHHRVLAQCSGKCLSHSKRRVLVSPVVISDKSLYLFLPTSILVISELIVKSFAHKSSVPFIRQSVDVSHQFRFLAHGKTLSIHRYAHHNSRFVAAAITGSQPTNNKNRQDNHPAPRIIPLHHLLQYFNITH